MALLHGGASHALAPETHHGFPDTRLEYLVWLFIQYAPLLAVLLAVAIVVYIAQSYLRR